MSGPKKVTFAPGELIGSFGVPVDSSDTTEIWTRITARYGVTRLDAASERLTAVLAAIAQRRRLQ